jgi:gliding motility-associated-like protein
MHLMIFNQWGEKIFETSQQQPGWDGMYKGKPAPVGVYVYVLNMTMQDGTTVNKKGTINLIR